MTGVYHYWARSRSREAPCGRRAVTCAQRLLATAKKKGSRRVLPVGIHKCRQRPTFPLSSIIGGRNLTTVFGMVTGVTSHLWSPTNPAAGFHRRPVLIVVNRTSVTRSNRRMRSCEAWPPPEYRARNQGRNPVDVTKSSTVSTASLRVFLPVHVRPINLVVFQGSLVPTNRDMQHSSPGELPA